MLQQRSLRLLSSLSHCAFRSPVAPLSASQRCRTRRAYSIHANVSVGEKIQNIDPSKLTITKTTTPKDLLPPEELIFGRNFSGKSTSGVIVCLYLTSKPKITCCRLNGQQPKDGCLRALRPIRISVSTLRRASSTMHSSASRA